MNAALSPGLRRTGASPGRHFPGTDRTVLPDGASELPEERLGKQAGHLFRVVAVGPASAQGLSESWRVLR